MTADDPYRDPVNHRVTQWAYLRWGGGLWNVQRREPGTVCMTPEAVRERGAAPTWVQSVVVLTIDGEREVTNGPWLRIT